MGGGGGWAEVRVIGLVHLHVPWTTIFLCRFLSSSSSSSSSSLLFQSKCPAAGTQQSSRDKDTYIPSSRLLWPFAFFLYLFICRSLFSKVARSYLSDIIPDSFPGTYSIISNPERTYIPLRIVKKKTKKNMLRNWTRASCDILPCRQRCRGNSIW